LPQVCDDAVLNGADLLSPFSGEKGNKPSPAVSMEANDRLGRALKLHDKL